MLVSSQERPLTPQPKYRQAARDAQICCDQERSDLTIEQEKLSTEKQDRNVKHHWVEQEAEKSEFGIQNEYGHNHDNYHSK
ncbi:hypothetical protein [Rhodanobacter soli]|uniref:hypothetical protein n=1 Tax=Rhodanobacter soli TaxID=590609 RepID=UPI0031DDB283